VNLLFILAIGLGAAVLFRSSALSVGLAAQFDHWMYLPFMAKPVPTPTLTPTATPLPPKVDVRVEGENTCSRFRGGSRQDPNGEYVCFRNYDVQPADMTGWRVEDGSRHSYSFPAFTLDPGAIVRLHSGPGTDTATDLHWGRGLVWNNDHDTVYLYDAFGRLVSRHVY
jgi:competence protein ComEC